VSVVQLEGGQPVAKTEIQTTDSGDAPIEEYTEEADTPQNEGIPQAS
jgi:hypothetical protein